MEAIIPGHANRLLNYDCEPATPPNGVTLSQELHQWYERAVAEIVTPPIAEEELAEVELLFSSLDGHDLLAHHGLESAGRWVKDQNLYARLLKIAHALPLVEAANEGYERIEEILHNYKKLGLILEPRRGFCRSIVPTDTAATQNYQTSKGTIHTRYDGPRDDTVYELSEVHTSDIALLTAHEVLIRRLAKQPSVRHTTVPFEYSRARRLFRKQEHSFPNIDAARRFVGEIAQKGCWLPHMNEPYQQGLLSILQTCSLFPDVVDRFRASDRDGFVAMQEKVAQLWPAPGLHGALAQCGFAFEPGLLAYDNHEVQIDSKLEEAFAELPQAARALRLQHMFEVPLYVGPRTTVAFEASDLPYVAEDTRDIPGKLRFYPQASPFKQRAYPRCPALGGSARQESLIARMAGLVYDHAKAIEPTCMASVAVLAELDNDTLFQLVDTPEFRQCIPPAERQTWIADGVDLIESGIFREPQLRDVYLRETVKPVLIQLGRASIKRKITSEAVHIQ